MVRFGRCPHVTDGASEEPLPLPLDLDLPSQVGCFKYRLRAHKHLPARHRISEYVVGTQCTPGSSLDRRPWHGSRIGKAIENKALNFLGA